MIVVDRVSKYYGAHPAVDKLDFKIEEGECIGFLGRNGAGKTTMLRLLSCLALPTSGRIKIKGLDVEDEPHEIRKLIGFLPDTPPLYPDMEVEGYLRFAGLLRRMSKEALKKRIPQVLKQCGLVEVRDQPITTLSHGYKQRVGIGQAIIHNPTLLILDEPTQGLDPVQIVEMRELIRTLRGKHTILLSSHILSEIAHTCDRILMLDDGRLVAQGTEEELLGESGEAGSTTNYVMEVEVRTTRGELEKAFESLENTEILHAVSVGDGVLRAKIGTSGDQRPAVAKAIVNADLELLTLRRSQAALEDIFVRFTKNKNEKSRGKA